MTARLRALAIAAALALMLLLSQPAAAGRLLDLMVPALAGMFTVAVLLAASALIAARALSPSTPWYPLAALWRRLIVITIQPLPGLG